jgi:hypothetical protein
LVFSDKTDALTSEQKRKSKMKIKIWKRIKSKIKIKSNPRAAAVGPEAT